MKKFYFLSGLPRTGSTLLASILNQNPNIHVSGTSALLELLTTTGNGIATNRSTYEITEEQEINIYYGIINGQYQHIDKNIIFDKHRGWPSMIQALQKIKHNPKILCTIRTIPEIIVSYIKLIEKNPNFLNFIDDGIKKKRLGINTFNRAMTIWFECIHPSYSLLRDIIVKNRENFLIVQYDDIVVNPMMVLNDVHSFFNIESYDGYDFNNIINTQPEKDEEGWKMIDLHKIRPELRKTSISPEKVLGTELVKYFNQFNLVV